VLENRAILTILDVSLRDTTENMLNGIRGASLAKWMLAGVALAAFAVSFFRVKKT
jgi:hypothetical protein